MSNLVCDKTYRLLCLQAPLVAKPSVMLALKLLDHTMVNCYLLGRAIEWKKYGKKASKSCDV